MSSSHLRYVSASGVAVELDGELAYVGPALGIRGRAWEYELGRRGITGQVRRAREATLEATFLSLAEADRARRAMDADVSAGTPGSIVSGDWEQRAYVVVSEPSARGRTWMAAELTVLLLDGAWHREVTTSFLPASLDSDVGKAYSYGYPYGYAPPAPARTVKVAGSTPSPFRMVVWGRAVNPSVTIAGNVYAFDVVVPAGGYLVVDTMGDPTVELVTADGIRSDAFRYAHRGEGEGSGEYAFQPIPPGSQMVSWDDSFGFDLTLYEEEGEIPWSS